MKVKILGVQEVDFEARDGNRVIGTRLYMAYPDPNVEGHASKDVFISGNGSIAIPELKPGDDVVVETDFSGKILGIRK